MRQRSGWLAYLGVSWALGTVAGPLVGAVFAQNPQISWRWIFTIDMPLLFLSTACASLFLGYEERPWPSLKTIRFGMDWGGSALFGTSGSLVLLSLTCAGSYYPWISAQVISLLVFGLIGFVGLGMYEAYVARYPIFPPRLFRRSSATILLVSVFMHGILTWTVLHYMWIHDVGVRGSGPLEAGISVLPATMTAASAAMLAGLFVPETGRYGLLLRAGWLLVATAGREDNAEAICMTLLASTVGQSIGVAIGLTTFSTALDRELGKLGAAEGRRRT
ncbi:Fungal trichothecene efflux pump (TRI12) [Geosmithia morbida]|uniref:Fungal trichothecene efflux pump (TRI12) n=1 Tax=Geosmithia morbida TaxID=1094350 RepID=A0A9P4Z2P1_9HYPO|nr:Fungal trichothecene efflux pump (TRI12) [Geosmithia morbida]KAF4125534.1 Fungal trichothecene efflux pump (TRI12) [Geosmithia morbida]